MMIEKLHYITQESDGHSHCEAAELACKNNIRWIQLRVKNKPYNEWLEIAKWTKEICDVYNAKLIINDNVDIALKTKADGVHLGKNDMTITEAREILGCNFIIGGTANTFEDIQRLSESTVNYIGLGPFRFTTTKEKLSPILGLEGYENIFMKCREAGIDIPLIAIGGILVEDINSILGKGIYGIAVSSAISKAENKDEIIKCFNTTIKEFDMTNGVKNGTT